jgi:hypothetical protein
MAEPASDPPRPLDEPALREEIKRVLDGARAVVRDYTGLDARQDLAAEVMTICERALPCLESGARLQEAKRLLAERCAQLARVSDRFVERDPAAIGAVRILTLAALDTFQDAVFERRKLDAQPRGSASLLRKQAQSPSSPQIPGPERPRART